MPPPYPPGPRLHARRAGPTLDRRLAPTLPRAPRRTLGRMPAILTPPPGLGDERIALRLWREEDVAWIARESADPLIPAFTNVPDPNTETDVRAFLLAQEPLRQRGDGVQLIAVERASGERIGPLSIHRVEWRHRTAEVGYWTAAGMRGRGLTTAAARVVCAWGLGPLGLGRLELRIAEDNHPSQRLAERLGFTHEGVLRGAELRPGGRRALIVFGLLAGELT